jgi:hypothetical protein
MRDVIRGNAPFFFVRDPRLLCLHSYSHSPIHFNRRVVMQRRHELSLLNHIVITLLIVLCIMCGKKPSCIL